MQLVAKARQLFQMPWLTLSAASSKLKAWTEHLDRTIILWKGVVETYFTKGLTEGDALIQARLARILRHEDYDYKKKEPILWTPRTS